MPVGQSVLQLLEMIARRHAKVGIGGGVIQHLQLSEQPGRQIGRYPSGLDIPYEEIAQPGIPERDDHAGGSFRDLVYRSMGQSASASACPCIGWIELDGAVIVGAIIY